MISLIVRLADLLAREEQQYKAQLAALQPTVEDRRAEMESRALRYVVQ